MRVQGDQEEADVNAGLPFCSPASKETKMGVSQRRVVPCAPSKVKGS